MIIVLALVAVVLFGSFILRVVILPLTLAGHARKRAQWAEEKVFSPRA